ncbi:MAG: SpoIID/LytB domain-containing protein, partial [Melioribacteraceae bacterium]
MKTTMNEPFVNVAILSEDEVEFELHGDFSSNELNKRINGKYKASIRDNLICLQSDEETISSLQEIVLTPSEPLSESFLLKNVTIGLQFHWEQKQNQRFSGSLKIIVENKKLTVINIVSVEQYLISVISSEMSPTSSLELLKAHAVISRSWLLAQMEKRQNIKEQNYFSEIISDDEIIKWYDREDHILYDVCADDHCQRYQGITKLHAHTAEQAVVETTGSVLMFENKICDARFSKSCGGITESFENVWENIEHPYLQKIVDYKFEPDEYDTSLTTEDAAKDWILNSPKAFCNTTDEKILEQVLNNYDRKTKD